MMCVETSSYYEGKCKKMANCQALEQVQVQSLSHSNTPKDISNL